MEVIPVIDLVDSVVVRARMGQRDQYRPIETPLSPTSDPLDVARGLLSVYPFETLYVADLDAIAGTGDNLDVLARLKRELPQVTLWLDSGVANRRAADAWVKTGLGHLVLGSESQSDLGLVRQFAQDPRVVLSLDFRAADFQGPPSLLATPEMWPKRLIVMTLARVGSGAGPDLERLLAIRDVAAGRKIYAAGGVRDSADLAALERAGIAGALVASCLHDGRLAATQISALHRMATAAPQG